jgi:hypothetical protein
MIEVIFTLDYEIYGNGEGSLKKQVYEPAEKLRTVFNKWNASFVAFIEVAELEMMELVGSDQAIDMVGQQIKDLYKEGFELGLHIHPQWYNARWEQGQWKLDYSEYNLCNLSRDRIVSIIDRSISYLKRLSGGDDFAPFSFRAGNWLFQPTRTVGEELAKRSLKVDSSVFKGGLQNKYKLDYRGALRNGYFWPFSDDVNVSDPKGALMELPIYSKMVPAWELLTSKRVSLQRKGPAAYPFGKAVLDRIRDVLRVRYPKKFDFCRMTTTELIPMLGKEIRKDKKNPGIFRPIIAIGHTKDLIDIETVEALLSHVRNLGIPISNLKNTYEKCISQNQG